MTTVKSCEHKKCPKNSKGECTADTIEMGWDKETGEYCITGFKARTSHSMDAGVKAGRLSPDMAKRIKERLK